MEFYGFTGPDICVIWRRGLQQPTTQTYVLLMIDIIHQSTYAYAYADMEELASSYDEYCKLD